MKQIILFLVFLHPFVGEIFGCSCSTINFCEFVNSNDSFLAIKGKVIKHSTFESLPNGLGGQAIYVEILKKYKDAVGITDTIKLYGSWDGGSCTENLIANHSIGSTIICAFGENNYNEAIQNPDSLVENYWEWFPHLCSFPNLKLTGDAVEGLISPDVRKYPLIEFEENLSSCNFSYDEILNFDCDGQILKLYPNPTLDGTVYLESNYFANSITDLNVTSISGVKQVDKPFEVLNIGKIKISNLQNGINLLVLKIKNEVCLRTIISENKK